MRKIACEHLAPHRVGGDGERGKADGQSAEGGGEDRRGDGVTVGISGFAAPCKHRFFSSKINDRTIIRSLRAKIKRKKKSAANEKEGGRKTDVGAYNE